MRYTITDRDPYAAKYRAKRYRRPPVAKPPLECIDCQGTGTLHMMDRICSHHGNCPCGVDEYDVTCTVCDGTGRRKCDHCGDFDAVLWLGDDAVCSACMEAS